MNPELLAILITVRQATQAVNQIKSVREQLGLTVEEAKSAVVALRSFAIGAAFAFAGLKSAASDEFMRLQLEGITHSGSLAVTQMQRIRAESEKGLFDKSQIFGAIKLLDETKSSISDLLPLAKELSLRGGGDLTAAAKALGSLNTAGTGNLAGLLRQAGISVRELREAGLPVTANYEIRGTPRQTLEALRSVLAKNNLSNLLEGSLSASAAGTIASLKDLFVSIGNGLLPIIKPVLAFLTSVIQALTWVNNLTGGWLSNMLLVLNAFGTLSAVLPLLVKIGAAERVAAYWAGILAAINLSWKDVQIAIWAAVYAMQAWAAATSLEAVLLAIVDFLLSPIILLVAAIAAIAGVIGYFSGAFGGSDSGADGDVPAQQPVRRSDIENQFSRARARAYA